MRSIVPLVWLLLLALWPLRATSEALPQKDWMELPPGTKLIDPGFFKYCNLYTQIATKESLRVYFNDLKAEPLMDEYLTTMSCGLKGRHLLGGILWNSVTAADVKALMIIALYNHYNKRNKLAVFDQILNGINENGFSFLDYVELDSNMSNQVRASNLPIKQVLCQHGARYHKNTHLNKDCIREK